MQSRGAGEQIEGLENESNFLVANISQFIVSELAHQLAVQPVLPSVGVSRQPIRFISVDLPEPEGPMMATYSLRSNLKIHAGKGMDLLLQPMS